MNHVFAMPEPFQVPDDREPYLLTATADQAVLTRPGTFFQLINGDNNGHCDVLYIVNPGYLFLFNKVTGKVIYDDSVVLNGDWDDLRESGWHHSVELPTMEQRHDAYRSLAVKDN